VWVPQVGLGSEALAEGYGIVSQVTATKYNKHEACMKPDWKLLKHDPAQRDPNPSFDRDRPSYRSSQHKHLRVGASTILGVTRLTLRANSPFVSCGIVPHTVLEYVTLALLEPSSLL
jgi:hypothetical protein